VSAYLDELYLEWLYSQICSVRLTNPSRTYRKLFQILFTKEFVWFIPNDDNRVEDGKQLRYEFLDDASLEDLDRDWMAQDCSFLELLIGLSRRLAFETNREPDSWFWELLENLGLRDLNDRVHIPRDVIEEKMDRVIWRTYRYNGQGGLFPLRRAGQDQRDVELWYQLSAYILERS
jgi:hypothetical protein